VPNHWTYTAFDPGADLFQGDIIARTEPLLKVLEEVHRHFCNEKYLAFLVTSQTCDLVLRKQSRCKTRHITLAVVRALEDVVPDLFADASTTGLDGVYRQEDKGEARDQLERILNQNEQAQGIFYLHPDADVRIAVHAVSLLRVSIALRSREHYRLVQEARCGRLSTEYRYKLGWLTGNLFSRVDTPDWSDHEGGPAESEEIIAGFVEGSKLARPNVWVPGSWIQAARKKNVKIEELPRDAVFGVLEEHAPPPRNEVVIGRIRDVGAKVLPLLGEDQVAAIIDGLAHDVIFATMIADRASVIIRAVLPELLAFEAIREDAAFLETLMAPVADALASFREHRGPRELGTFVGYLSRARLFSDAAITRLRVLIASMDGCTPDRLDEIEASLRAEKPPATITAYIRSLAAEASARGVIERLIGRLENDQAMKAALK